MNMNHKNFDASSLVVAFNSGQIVRKGVVVAAGESLEASSSSSDCKTRLSAAGG